MKIIKRGTNPDDAPMRSTCAKCRSELEFTREEARFMEGDRHIDPGSYYVVCPVCGGMAWAR